MKTMKFSEQFVPLIEQGLKTQTRRLMNPQPAIVDSTRFFPESKFKVGDIFSVNGTDLNCQIVNVRVERVQDISETEAENEGFEFDEWGEGEDHTILNAKDLFKNFWDDLYSGSWERNDWVWVYEFKKSEVRE